MKILFRKLFRLVVIGLLSLFVVIQLIPYGHDHTNPPVVAEPEWNTPQTRATFFKTCGNCHSNTTEWPWYSNVAPISWSIQNHVEEGRSRFNVSQWSTNHKKGDDAAEEVQSGGMPLSSYLLLHPEARLTQSEQEQFIAGLKATFGATDKQGNEMKSEDGDDD